MILVIKEKHDTKNYRLRAFYDFEVKVCQETDCYLYGLDSDSYNPRKTIQDILTDMPKKPDAIFVMAPLFKMSKWERVPCKKLLLVTDVFNSFERMNRAKHYPGMDKIKWDYVLHNYFQDIEFMKRAIPSEWVFFPNWAAEWYDYEKHGVRKDFDFFLSGKLSSEYEMRKRFHKAFHKAGFDVVDNLAEVRVNTADDNSKFRDLLLRSMYSPHDGGINGRMVPRYVESALAKSLLISPSMGKEMDLMGFKAGENYIEIRRSSTKEQIRKFLRGIDAYDWEGMVARAYELVSKKHTTMARIQQLLGLVYED
jgi:hypothetical protein